MCSLYTGRRLLDSLERGADITETLGLARRLMYENAATESEVALFMEECDEGGIEHARAMCRSVYDRCVKVEGGDGR